MPAINKICRSLLFSPHHLGNLQNFAVDRGHHHSVKFTVRTGLFGLKGTHIIFAVGGPSVPEWNWLETSTEYHETEFSQANGVSTDVTRALRSQALTTHCLGAGCTCSCRCAYGNGKENEYVGELHCCVG